MESKLLDADRAHSIIGGFYAVYNYYGYGLAESVYAGGLEYELGDRGHTVVRELPAFASRQLVNYLRATSYQLGFLLHFGPDAKYQRFVDSQKRRFGVTPSQAQ